MESSINASKENNKKNESAKLNPITEKIKSDYFLQKLYYNIQKKKKLEIARWNKKTQNRLNLSIKDYKETFSPIEIEIIPAKGKYGEFIKVNKNDNHKKIKNLKKKYKITQKNTKFHKKTQKNRKKWSDLLSPEQ